MCSKCKQESIPSVALALDVTSKGFTSILQSGIFLSAPRGIGIGKFLQSLPGFSREYIENRVETIFVNGLPVDDFTHKLVMENTVVAISAAMPGLAGAIFRKNSVHAPLRTSQQTTTSKQSDQESITVQLKLFNAIARERGVGLLSQPCLIAGDPLQKLLDLRPPLTASIKQIMVDNTPMDMAGFKQLLTKHKRIKLTIQGPDDN